MEQGIQDSIAFTSVSRVESFQGAVFIVEERVKNQSSSLVRGLTHPSGQIKEGWCGT